MQGYSIVLLIRTVICNQLSLIVNRNNGVKGFHSSLPRGACRLNCGCAVAVSVAAFWRGTTPPAPNILSVRVYAYITDSVLAIARPQMNVASWDKN